MRIVFLRGLIQIAKKLICDELVWGPILTVAIFYVLPLVETQDHQQALSELKAKFLNAWIGSAGFWIVFQSINFRFVPLKYRVAYMLMLDFVYDIAIAIYRYQY